MRRTIPAAPAVVLLMLAAGCPPTPAAPEAGTTVRPADDAGTTAPHPGEGGGTLGLGEEADEAWAELAALWEETGSYRAHEVAQETLARAEGRVAGLLLRLGAVDGVLSGAPGLLELLGAEFDERLSVAPAEAVCVEDDGTRTPAGRAWERLAARVDALESLADAGYGNAWLRTDVLPRVREDAAMVRAAQAQGDDWRTEDERLRAVSPQAASEVLERIEAALSRMAER